MWYFYNKKLTTVDGEYIYRIKELLKTAGWSITSSGDGLSIYSSSGDIITKFASGANGINSRSWFVATHPSSDGYQNSFSFQGGGVSIRIKHSVSGFNLGSPTYNTVPSAADEIVLYGSGTDASPSPSTIIPTSGYQRLNFIAGDSSEKFSFYMINTLLGFGTITTAIVLDRLIDTDPTDVNPYMFFATGSSTAPPSLNNWSDNGYTTSSVLKGWTRYGFADASTNTLQALWWGSQIGYSGSDPYNGNDLQYPFHVAATTGYSINKAFGYKGKSRILKLSGTPKASSEATDNYTKIAFGPIIFPWDGTAPSI